MLNFDAVLAALAWLGRQGTRALALSVFVGIALPPLAAVLRHLFVEALLVLLTLTFLRVEPENLIGHFRKPRLVAMASVWTLIVTPALFCGIAMAFGLPQTSEALFLALALQMVSPPIIGAPALAALLGLDASLSLATLIVATAATPLTVPLLAGFLDSAALDIPPLWLGVKLLLMLGGPALAAIVLRKVIAADRLARHGASIDGLSVIALFVFTIGLMHGFGRQMFAQPGLLAILLAVVYALSIVLIASTALIFHRAGRSSALALGLAVGSRNMGLMVAAAGSAVPELVWIYFAVAQFPIYTLPHLLQPFIHRWIAGDGLPPDDDGVRRTAKHD